METTPDIYTISNYTDQELYTILDLQDPTDRELEAKIIQQITKYESMKNPFGDNFVNFFHSVYSHFFDIDEDEHDDPQEAEPPQESLIENFETTEPKPTLDIKRTEPTNNTSINYLKNIEYSKGNLNPILKETIKRVISIDSQYRNTSVYPYSTDYTFNLSDVLQDVVSLKLYSVQIPYTWYTINNNYGANFFYIKGNSPGIDNGNFDYKIEIGAGNYTSAELISRINTAFSTILTANTDVSFGTTKITYDSNKINATITLDIQNRFNESYYELYFPTWTTPQDASFINQTKSIPGFLGFNNTVYTPFSIYSKSFSSKIDISATSTETFTVDSTNHTFYIYNYLGPEEFNTTYNTTTYQTFPDVSNNIIYNTIPITLTMGSNRTRSQIIADINSQFSSNTTVQSSTLSIVDVSNITNIYPDEKIKMDIHINRMISNLTNSKVVVIFPSGDSQLWNGSTSCFQMPSPIMEINNILSETSNQVTNYIVSSGLYIDISCIAPGYDVSTNNYQIDIANSTVAGGYSLDEFITAIQTGLTAEKTRSATDGDFFLGTVKVKNSLTNLDFNFEKKFTTVDYRMDVSGSILESICKVSSATTANSSGTTNFTGNFIKTTTIYEGQFDSNTTYATNANTVKIYSIGDISSNTDSSYNGIYNYKTNKNAPVLEISFNNFGSQETLGLQEAINHGFKNTGNLWHKYTIDGSNTSMNANIDVTNTQIEFYKITQSFVYYRLTVDITRRLTESDYIVTIVDPDTQYDSSGNVIPSSNHWYSDLGFTTSTYRLNDLSGGGGGGTIATVKASNYINSNELVLDASNNYFYIQPMVNSNGGVYSSTEENVIKIMIDLEDGAYSRAVVLAALQESLTNNSITTGSTIETYYDSSLNDYSKIRLNLNKIFRTSDYKIVFYDLLSFSHCNFGNTKSLQNITSDTTLGWIIGFRSKTEYLTTPENISYNTSFTPATTYYTDSPTTAYTYNTTTNVATITGDTTISINLYNYFLIVLDDYTQNHLNDGLVTITATDSSIALPSYASRAITRCNPSTKETYMNSNILTSKQIYAANEILKNKQSSKNINSLGPFVQDIFGIIPMKTSGLQPGSSYIEFGGTLQNQDRTYFGPVNIRRMSIKLLNDKGNVVDLNNSDWSFSLIAEQLYNPNTNSSKK